MIVIVKIIGNCPKGPCKKLEQSEIWKRIEIVYTTELLNLTRMLKIMSEICCLLTSIITTDISGMKI